MPPKRRLGRPPGTKNKKKIKTENEHCEFCKVSYDSAEAYEEHLQFCKKSLLQNALVVNSDGNQDKVWCDQFQNCFFHDFSNF